MKSNFRWVKCILIKEAFFLIVPMTCIYLTVTYIHITLEVRIPSVFQLQYKCKEFLLCIQRPKIFNSLSSAIQNASSTAVFTSKLIKRYFLSFLLFSHFALFVLSFSFFSFFFCALALLVYLFLSHLVIMFYVINKYIVYV